MATEENVREMNIYQKLAKIRKPVEVIKKNRQGYGYKYVDEEEILSKITGLMGKYGVSLLPNIVHDSTVVEPYHYMKTKATKDGKIYEEHVNEILVRADMEWIWVNDDRPEDRVIVPWIFVGSQADASQAFGSGLTYSSRYFLLKYFNVATSDDDPDNWRNRQREAEKEVDRLVAEQILNQVHTLVTEHLAAYPDSKQDIISVTKRYAKENGKASANYFAIENPTVASELLKALNTEVFEKNNKKE